MNKFSHLVKRCDHKIFASSVSLSLIGIFTLTAITYDKTPFLSREVIIQSAALVIGITFACVILMLGYRYFTDLEKVIYISSIMLLLLVYIPGLGTSVNGARSWIDLGFISFQPSEIVKISFILLMASYLSRSASSLSDNIGILSAALYGLPFILLVSREDFGSGCIYCAIWLFMIFCSGLKLKIIGRFALVFTMMLPMFYFFLADYQKERIDAFLDPADLDLPGNYQVWNSKVAIGSGGLFGKGWMNGTQSSLGFLPVPQSDFIFAASVEIIGFCGGLVIILLFALLIYRALMITRYAKDLQGALTGAGIAGMFFFQSFENIAMTMGLMPVTGITLPFMSYGGTSMVSAWMGVGLLLSVSCRQRL
ncbi:MAG: FtsW/RodA/SpoVE family cell cycle protein [Bacillota bacterium]|nr:FtsW/RodA/SpoVE family cell cycle protein [Bacillota bacterium]